MARRSRECYLCGEKYSYCGSCSNDRMKPSWMAEFHEENCKNIFDICTRYNMGMVSKDDAKVMLLACDLSNKDNFKDYVQHDIAVILADETKTKRGNKVEATVHEVVNKTENK